MKYWQCLLQAAFFTLASIATIGEAATFDITTKYSGVTGIIRGPDGAMWFTEPNAQQVGRITTNGAISEFSVPGVGSTIAVGPDGNLWCTGQDGISRVARDGTLTQFPVKPFAYVKGIAAGPDGNLWFTMWQDDKIGRITPQGDVTTYPLPSQTTDVWAITQGADGNLWFTEEHKHTTGRITPQGVITEFPSGYGATYIAAGSDGNLWYSGYTSIGRFSPSGEVTEFRLRNLSCSPGAIVAGPDGNLWFVEKRCDAFGKITPQGVITEYPFPLSNTSLSGLAFGTDGQLWITDSGNNKIVSLSVPTGSGTILTSLNLICPVQIVAEENGGRCAATAKYADGTSLDVTENISALLPPTLVSSDTTALSISVTSVHGGIRGGDLIAGSVTKDTSVSVKATYTENGVTQQAEANLLIKALPPLTTVDSERIFRWAEYHYPQLFPGTSSTQTAQGYTYRHYPKAGVYLATKDARVILHDGKTWNFFDVGSANNFLQLAKSEGY